MFLTERHSITLKDVDSTNNYATRLIAEKAGNGTVVLAQYQNQGRGQCGNFWESEAGKNLLFSVILYPDFIEAAKQFYISKAVSLALADVLSQETENVCIKWPNDIYVGEKKIAGILIENTIKGSNLDSSVVGIGLNVNQENFISNAPNPVSLKQLTNKEFDVKKILINFMNSLDEYIEILKQKKFDIIDKAYLFHLFRKNGWHKYQKDGTEFEARIAGIGTFGQLQLEERSGKISEFMFKEVEFVKEIDC